MSYLDIANMTVSGPLMQRITACAAEQGSTTPDAWLGEHRWTLCASPGWDDAWASAVAAGNPDPGADEAVISDAMILSAVQGIGVA